MKTAVKFMILLSVVAMVVSQCVSAQTTPRMSTKYTNEALDNMLMGYERAHSRDTYPAQAIVNKFMKDFPKAEEVEWEKSESLYEVEFEVGGMSKTDYKAYYDTDGELLMYKEDIRAGDVPATVKSAALARYPKFKIDDADRIVRGTETIYKLDLERGKQEVKIAIKQDGTVLEEYYDF